MSNEPKYGMRREDDIQKAVKQHADEVLEAMKDSRAPNVVPFKAKIYWRDSTGKEAIEPAGQLEEPELFLQDSLNAIPGKGSLNEILTEYGKTSKPPDGHGLQDDRKPVAITISCEVILVNRTFLDEQTQEPKWAGNFILLFAGRTENGVRYMELCPLAIKENGKHYIPNDPVPPGLQTRLDEAKANASDFMNAFFQGYAEGGKSNFKFIEV